MKNKNKKYCVDVKFRNEKTRKEIQIRIIADTCEEAKEIRDYFSLNNNYVQLRLVRGEFDEDTCPFCPSCGSFDMEFGEVQHCNRCGELYYAIE